MVVFVLLVLLCQLLGYWVRVFLEVPLRSVARLTARTPRRTATRCRLVGRGLDGHACSARAAANIVVWVRRPELTVSGLELIDAQTSC